MQASKNVTVQNGVTTVESSILIDAPRAKVWEVLSKPGNIADFHPLVKHSKLTSTRESGLQTRRYCALVPMGEIWEVISEWNKGQGFTSEVERGKSIPPMQLMRLQVHLAEQDSQTEARIKLEYQLKFGFFGKVMDAILVRPIFSGAPVQYLRGLKFFVENGRKMK